MPAAPYEPPVPSQWVDLDPPTAAEALRPWVTDVLVPRYPFVTVGLAPPCWERHIYLLQELYALHLVWWGAFHDGSVPTEEWQSLLAETCGRVRLFIPCAPGEHTESPAVGDPTDSGFDAFVAKDVASRPTRPPDEGPLP